MCIVLDLMSAKVQIKKDNQKKIANFFSAFLAVCHLMLTFADP
jgi:hypothetical protein